MVASWLRLEPNLLNQALGQGYQNSAHRLMIFQVLGVDSYQIRVSFGPLRRVLRATIERRRFQARSSPCEDYLSLENGIDRLSVRA